MQKYYKNGCKTNDVYSRNNLPKLKDGAHVINLDEYKSTGTHWIALYVNEDSATYFDGFVVEDSPKEIKKFIENTNVVINNCRVQFIEFSNVWIVLDLLILC